MSNNKSQPKTENNSQQPKPSENRFPLKTVRQDKYARRRVRIASSQPVTVKRPARTRPLNNSKPRSQKRNVNKNGLVPLTTHFDPIVKEKIQRYASERGISLPEAVAILLERSIQEKIIKEQIEFIKPIIENTIAKKMREAYEFLDALEDRLFPKKPIRRKN